MPTVCVDTNIWVYSLGTPQAKDDNKQVMAQAAIKSAGKITLTPQIINELGFVLIRKQGWSNDDLQPMIENLLKQCTLAYTFILLAPTRLAITERFQLVLLGWSGSCSSPGSGLPHLII